MRRPKKNENAQTKMRCARADQNEMRMRSSTKGAHVQAKKEPHEQAKKRCACAGKNEMHMSKCK